MGLENRAVIGSDGKPATLKQSDDEIGVDSEPRKATTCIYIPQVEAPLAEENERLSSPAKGSETILMVEDEDIFIETTKLMKGCLIFIMLMMTIAINTDENVIARLGFEPGYLVMSLSAVSVAGLIMHRNLALVVVVVLLSVGANSPQDFMLNMGIDPDFLLGTLVAIVLAPVVALIAVIAVWVAVYQSNKARVPS